MDYPQPVKTAGQPRILVVPLDWGLGHATRCIPVVYELMRQGADVWLAGGGAQEILLKKEFPALPFLDLHGYRVKYGNTPASILKNLLFRTPALLQQIKNEHKWLKKMVAQYQFDAVISDNRFGLYHPAIPSVFITHQLNIKSPLGKWSETFLQKINYRYINRFTECWIPDEKNETNLAGELSHPSQLPAIPVNYIGLLSRLKRNNISEKKNHLFISLSGPEPQRTILENLIIKEIAHYKGTATIVRGVPGAAKLIPSTNDIRFYNHLSSEEYSREMEIAEYVISRSGYSTVMDIAALGKKSILIPTPGQTEQEYLAEYLMNKNITLSVSQDHFVLADALQKASEMKYKTINVINDSSLSSVVSSLLADL